MTANSENAERILSDLKRVVRDSEELMHDSTDALSDKAHEMRERLAKGVQLAKEACARLQEKTKNAARATDTAIREHPYQSLAIALGAVVLIGVLFGRKR